MDTPTVEVAVRLRTDQSGHTITFVHVPPSTTLLDLQTEVLRRLGIQDLDEDSWQLSYAGEPLSPDLTVDDFMNTWSDSYARWGVWSASNTVLDLSPYEPASNDSDDVESFCKSLDSSKASAFYDLAGEEGDYDLGPPEDLELSAEAHYDLGAPEDLELSDEADYDLGAPEDLELSDEADAASSRGLERPASSAAKVARRGTVRYYSRMNPERVYPLMVAITEQTLSSPQMRDVRQATGNVFKLSVGEPLEIEPVIPGCTCYPPIISSIASSKDLSAQFHIVPTAVGRIMGAKVILRQSHVVLSELPLEIRVVSRSMTILSSVATFAVPATCSVMQHFGLTLEAGSAETDPYIVLAGLVLQQTSPLTLTLALGGATCAFAWHAWPRSQEVFWDTGLRTPEEALQLIKRKIESNPGAAYRELATLLQDNPHLTDARLLKAELDLQGMRYTKAIDGFLTAFLDATPDAADYEQLYRVSVRHGTPQQTLKVLEQAEQSLEENAMPSRLLYNLACYQARLGQEDAAMISLRKAFTAGYTKRDLASKDRDLRALHSRSDFQKLLAGG